jgi:hypothetical protein
MVPTQGQTWQVAMRTGSRALVTEGGDARACWTNLAAEVWEGCWKHELCREGVQVGRPKCEEYKGRRFYNGDCALMVDVWLHRVDEDASGLTFEEWDPSADTDEK